MRQRGVDDDETILIAYDALAESGTTPDGHAPWRDAPAMDSALWENLRIAYRAISGAIAPRPTDAAERVAWVGTELAPRLVALWEAGEPVKTVARVAYWFDEKATVGAFAAATRALADSFDWADVALRDLAYAALAAVESYAVGRNPVGRARLSRRLTDLNVSGGFLYGREPPDVTVAALLDWLLVLTLAPLQTFPPATARDDSYTFVGMVRELPADTLRPMLLAIPTPDPLARLAAAPRR